MTWQDLRTWMRESGVKLNARIKIETPDGSYALEENSLRVEEDEQETKQFVVIDATDLEI